MKKFAYTLNEIFPQNISYIFICTLEPFLPSEKNGYLSHIHTEELEIYDIVKICMSTWKIPYVKMGKFLYFMDICYRNFSYADV